MINNLIRILILISIIILTFGKLNSKIIYEKNDILITDYEIEFYKKYFYEIYKTDINDTQSIKNIVLIKNLIKKIYKNNPNLINSIDNKISLNSNLNIQSNTIYRDVNRFLILKNQYINEYIFNNLTPKDLLIPIKKLKNEKIPLGIKNCLFIDKVARMEEIKNFEEIYFKLLMENISEVYTTIDNQKYKICLPNNFKSKLEIEIIRLVEDLTSKDFNKLLYE